MATATALINDIKDLITDLDPNLLVAGEDVVIDYLADATITTLRTTYPPVHQALTVCDTVASISARDYCTRQAKALAASIIRRILLETGLIFLIRAAGALLQYIPAPLRDVILSTVRYAKEIASLLPTDLSFDWVTNWESVTKRLAAYATAKAMIVVAYLSKGLRKAAMYVSGITTALIADAAFLGKEVLDGRLVAEASAIAGALADGDFSAAVSHFLSFGFSYMDGVLGELGLPALSDTLADIGSGAIAVLGSAGSAIANAASAGIEGLAGVGGGIISGGIDVVEGGLSAGADLVSSIF